MIKTIVSILFVLFFSTFPLQGEVKVGIDVLLEDDRYRFLLEGKRIGLITNQTAIDSNFKTTFSKLRQYKLQAVFTPEHGFYGDMHADQKVADMSLEGVKIYSLYGKTRRPTADMLKNIDILVYDIQDIGSRSYTYISTLFYCMEEAALKNIPIMVLDRPNPMGGRVIDGPPLEEKWRSFVGYINVPYCHGMTVGELAQFFNEEYHVRAQLTVVPMHGWKRSMSFAKTGLPWVPTSPQIPEMDTALYYPMTGILGEFSLVNTGVGYTLPFKIVGAPWIEGGHFAKKLNEQNLPGVIFYPIHFKPFFGKFTQETCQGVKIYITDYATYLPVTTSYTILGVLKNLYSKEVFSAFSKLAASKGAMEMFLKINGTEKMFQMITEEQFFIWKVRDYFQKERESFLERRKKYLLPNYGI